MKRKGTSKKTKELVYGPFDELPDLTHKPLYPIKPSKVIKPKLKCVWQTRLIIPAEQTPSKTRYEFMPGQVKPVDIKDYDFLLSKKRSGGGCCNDSGTDVKYFEEV